MLSCVMLIQDITTPQYYCGGFQRCAESTSNTLITWYVKTETPIQKSLIICDKVRGRNILLEGRWLGSYSRHLCSVLKN